MLKMTGFQVIQPNCQNFLILHMKLGNDVKDDIMTVLAKIFGRNMLKMAKTSSNLQVYSYCGKTAVTIFLSLHTQLSNHFSLFSHCLYFISGPF